MVLLGGSRGPKYALDGPELSHVTQRRCRPVGIDVCDLAGGCPCALKRALHGQHCSAAVLWRLRDVVRVCGAAIAAKLQQQ